MIVLMLEHWSSSFLTQNHYLRGQAVGLMEVLVHSIAFWARLKQSAVIAKLLLQVQDFESGGLLRDKAVKIITALAKERH